MSVSYVYCNRCKCKNCSLENVVHMKDVDVAWRLIDVVREGQKLKKTTSNYKLMLLSLPGFESVCPNSFGYYNNRAQNKTEESVYHILC